MGLGPQMARQERPFRWRMMLDEFPQLREALPGFDEHNLEELVQFGRSKGVRISEEDFIVALEEETRLKDVCHGDPRGLAQGETIITSSSRSDVPLARRLTGPQKSLLSAGAG